MKSRVFFIEMMGVPGTYDASVYDHFEDKDNEGEWFRKRYSYLENINIRTRNVCIGEPLPEVDEFDGLVLAGTYNSVHDQTEWQRKVLSWFRTIRDSRKPLLGICGSHQLLAYFFGAEVGLVAGGPYAGTFPTTMTPAGSSSLLMDSLQDQCAFHYANREHVLSVPPGSTLLASSGRVPVAALDFSGHWYSTQFHPEASAETLGAVWRNTRPKLRENYHDGDAGDRLIENFLDIVVELTRAGVDRTKS